MGVVRRRTRLVDTFDRNFCFDHDNLADLGCFEIFGAINLSTALGKKSRLPADNAAAAGDAQRSGGGDGKGFSGKDRRNGATVSRAARDRRNESWEYYSLGAFRNGSRGLRLFGDCEFIGGTAKGTLEQFANFAAGDLTGTRFDTVDFSGVNLATQNLTRCSFRDCIFEDTNFEDAIISGARFSVFRSKDGHLTLDQIKSTWNYKHGRMEGIRLPEKLAKALGKEAEERNSRDAAGWEDGNAAEATHGRE